MTDPSETVLSDNHALLMQWVQDYCRNERNPTLRPFEVSEQPLPKDDVSGHRLAGRFGCYVIFTEAGNLKYVGMSWSQIGPRSLQHFKRFERVAFWMKSTPPTYVTLIAVHKPWEAPSLEAYLTETSKDLRKIADAELAGSSL